MTRQPLSTRPFILGVFVLAMGAGVRAQHDPAPSPAPATAPAPATKPAESVPAKPTAPPHPKPPDVKTVVERIQKRIDTELGPATSGAPRTATSQAAIARPTAAAPGLQPRRVHLTWRAELVWPDELTPHGSF